jgi:hypothetical protein
MLDRSEFKSVYISVKKHNLNKTETGNTVSAQKFTKLE